MKPTVIPLGAVASQRLRVRVASSEQEVFFTVAPIAAGEKLPARHHLEDGRRALNATIKEYVPDNSTAASWVTEFELFCGGQPTNELFADFCALVYYRTRIPKGQPGHLAVSSAATYLRYVTLKYKKYGHHPSFRAVETEAGSLGSAGKAPTAGEDHHNFLRTWFQSGPADELRLRGGAWLQTASGGRVVDVNRVRAGGITWGTKDGKIVSIRSLDWKWTKSIKRAKDGKTVFPPPQISDAIGPAPFSVKEWQSWCKREGNLTRPFSEYDTKAINAALRDLSQGFSERLTSTSLRDVYNRLVAEVCDNDATKMVQYTPHRSAKSLQSSYMSGRKISVRKTTVSKKAPVSEAKKKKK
jgi:hypothetical protein